MLEAVAAIGNGIAETTLRCNNARRLRHTSCGSSSCAATLREITERRFQSCQSTTQHTPLCVSKHSRLWFHVLKPFLGGPNRGFQKRLLFSGTDDDVLSRFCQVQVSLFKSNKKDESPSDAPLLPPLSSQSCSTQRHLRPLPLLAAQSQYACMPRASHLPTLQ